MSSSRLGRSLLETEPSTFNLVRPEILCKAFGPMHWSPSFFLRRQWLQISTGLTSPPTSPPTPPPNHLRITSESPPNHLRITSESPRNHLESPRNHLESPPNHLRITSESPPNHLGITSDPPNHLRITSDDSEAIRIRPIPRRFRGDSEAIPEAIPRRFRGESHSQCPQTPPQPRAQGPSPPPLGKRQRPLGRRRSTANFKVSLIKGAPNPLAQGRENPALPLNPRPPQQPPGRERRDSKRERPKSSQEKQPQNCPCLAPWDCIVFWLLLGGCLAASCNRVW